MLMHKGHEYFLAKQIFVNNNVDDTKEYVKLYEDGKPVPGWILLEHIEAIGLLMRRDQPFEEENLHE